MITRTYAGALWQSQNLPGAIDKSPVKKCKGRPKPRIDDKQCLEARALHEFFGWDEYRLADRYGVNFEYMLRQIIQYQSRVMMIPQRHHANLTEQ